MDSLPPQLMLLCLTVLFVIGFINALAKSVSDEDNALEIGSNKILLFVGVLFYALLKNPMLNIMSWANYKALIHILAFLIITVIILIFNTIFLVMIPKRIGAKYEEKLNKAFKGYVRFSNIVATPFVVFCEAVSRLVTKIFGIRDEDVEEEVTEEEIRLMVDIGSESGTIDDDEKQMIHNIFEMDDKAVSEIMTHRTEAAILWKEDNLDKWKEIIDETNHTRYPVCGESIDDVIGVVNSRDFYRFLLSGETDVETILREVYFIPDTIKADELLSQMQKENEHMAVIMDEFGGFQGIVTQEDLIEEIVGELYSEYDEIEVEESDIVKISDNTWKIDGLAEIEDIEEELQIQIEEGDYNTMAGLVLSELETIPADGDTFTVEIGNLKIDVVSVVDHRIEKTIVAIIEKEIEETE